MLVDMKDNSGSESEPLLQMKGLRIEGLSENGWQEIVCGIDLQLKRGEIIGLIGESGAGKSTIGLAAMGYAKTVAALLKATLFLMALNCELRPKRKNANSEALEFLMLPKALLLLLILHIVCWNNLQKCRSLTKY